MKGGCPWYISVKKKVNISYFIYEKTTQGSFIRPVFLRVSCSEVYKQRSLWDERQDKEILSQPINPNVLINSLWLMYKALLTINEVTRYAQTLYKGL